MNYPLEQTKSDFELLIPADCCRLIDCRTAKPRKPRYGWILNIERKAVDVFSILTKLASLSYSSLEKKLLKWWKNLQKSHFVSSFFIILVLDIKILKKMLFLSFGELKSTSFKNPCEELPFGKVNCQSKD